MNKKRLLRGIMLFIGFILVFLCCLMLIFYLRVGSL